MRRIGGSRLEHGDTIIEVIFAIVVFSFVAISSLMIMNRGIAVGEKALEITLVRQQINAQAEALRYIHEAYIVAPTSTVGAQWTQFMDENEGLGQAEASKYGVSGEECAVPNDQEHKAFILNARTAQVWSSPPLPAASLASDSPPYSQVVYENTESSVILEAYGIWVEAVPSDGALGKRFVDFHIRTCWPAPGSRIPMTLGTIVRLYDPI